MLSRHSEGTSPNLGISELERISFDEMAQFVRNGTRSSTETTSRRRSFRVPQSMFQDPDSLVSIFFSPQRGTRSRSQAVYAANEDDDPSLSYESLLELDKTIKKQGVSESSQRRYLKNHEPNHQLIDKDCHICMEQFHQCSGKLSTLPCKHTFQFLTCVSVMFASRNGLKRTAPVPFVDLKYQDCK
ncbi:hypothetical protein AKO1_013039 [Acrasis kona]|uniref:RING-type domain-containing protein n=1 Tax=Acrasis kona TaxID=1008807 RepID=A0AAW2YZF6_9EUKA